MNLLKIDEGEKNMKSIKALILLIISVTIGLVGCDTDSASNIGEQQFTNPLNIPEILEPTIDANGIKHFNLTMQKGKTEFFDGKQTKTWGINGSYLGPTIRVERGDQVAFDVTNNIGETSTLHWHGMHLPAEMDGGPHQMIEAGSTWNPYWTINQPAATTWYHPHLHGKTALHVYRGLAGMFIIDDEDSKKLPSEYGINDIPLVIQDKLFSDDGQFIEKMDIEPFGLMGNTVLVNGTYDPYLEISESHIRFRLLNGSNARAYHFGFDDGRSFQLVANDAGLLESPVELDRIMLSPGERAEIVVHFEPGEETILRSFKGENGIDQNEFEFLKIIASENLKETKEIPQELATEPRIEAPTDAKVRTFNLTTDSKINGKEMDMNRIDEVVTANTTEIWEITNLGWDHNFHIHDAAFRILDINGDTPPIHERGRKDTVFIPSGSTVRIAVQFGEYTDPSFPLMYHCHTLLHEDKGMMGQFIIVEPGKEDEAARYLQNKEHSEHH